MSTFARKVAWRFLLRGSARGGFSAMTVFAWLAIAVGVAAMCSLLSVMYGFESSLRAKVLTAYPHLMIRPRVTGKISGFEPWTDRLEKTAGIKRVEPYLEGEMIAQSERRAMGAVVWGIPAKDFDRIVPDIKEGRAPSPDSKLPGVVVGSELAGRLRAITGENLRILSPVNRSGAMGQELEGRRFEVSGLYTSGHYDFDQQYLFMDLRDAQDLLRAPNQISGWHLWACSHEEGTALRDSVQALLPPEWEALDWSSFNSALFQSLKLEQFAMFSILSFAVLIAVMNIIITLMMNVAHKKRNIGILRAIGATPQQVRSIFVWQGGALGVVGLASAAILFVVFIIYVRFFSSFQLPAVYYDRSIPVELRPLSIFIVFFVAGLLIFLATLWPAKRAAELDPVEAIRE